MKPDKNSYVSLSDVNSLIPVWDEILVDTETPITIFSKVAAEKECSYLLESVSAGGDVARYSFLGFDPIASFNAKGSLISVSTGEEEYQAFGNPVEYLKKFFTSMQTQPHPDLPFFPGGAVGFLSYDWVRYLERLPCIAVDDLGMPEGLFYVFRVNLIFDHARNSLKLVVLTEPGENPEDVYNQSVEIIEQLKRKISRETAVAINIYPLSRGTTKTDFCSTINRKEYMHAVEKIKEHIFAGDIFQAVLSTRLETTVKASPLEIYRCLRMVNPSPYMFLLNFPEYQLVGASPEMLVKVENGMIELRPIAGTRPRGANAAEEAALAEDMCNDIKEKAEHVMLVDLGRNDAGRVSEYGSVSVPKLMEVEKYSHVMHMVSSVTGKLQKEKDALDALMACFPAGTVSGAPKIRAMEIIEEIEPVRRGPYAGTVGYLGLDGSLNTCITIRTVLLKDGKAYVQAGAGIVADSDPEREFEECMSKAQGLTETLALAERSGVRDIGM